MVLHAFIDAEREMGAELCVFIGLYLRIPSETLDRAAD